MIRSYVTMALTALCALELSTAFMVSPRMTRTTVLKAADAAPEVSMPDVDVDLSGVLESADALSDQASDLMSSLDLPPEVLAGVGVVAVLGIAASAMGGGSESSDDTAAAKPAPKKAVPKAPKIDVSIPYDAAARMAFEAWAEGQEKADTSEKAFAAFSTMYEAQAVADVTAKQMKRNMANFDPSKPVPVPPTPVVAVAAAKTPTPPKAPPAPKAPAKKIDTSKAPFFATAAK